MFVLAKTFQFVLHSMAWRTTARHLKVSGVWALSLGKGSDAC